MSEVAQLSTAPPALLRDRLTRKIRARDGADSAGSAAIGIELAKKFGGLDLFGRLGAIRSQLAGRVVFTTSFGLEDQAIAHAIFSQDLAIDVATLDTGRLFPETHEVWAETERRYGARILAYAPDHASVQGLIAQQ